MWKKSVFNTIQKRIKRKNLLVPDTSHCSYDCQSPLPLPSPSCYQRLDLVLANHWHTHTHLCLFPVWICLSWIQATQVSLSVAWVLRGLSHLSLAALPQERDPLLMLFPVFLLWAGCCHSREPLALQPMHTEFHQWFMRERISLN